METWITLITFAIHIILVTIATSWNPKQEIEQRTKPLWNEKDFVKPIT